MIKNKKIKSIIIIILTFILSFFIEKVVFNEIKMHNIGKDKGIISLNNYLEIDETSTIVSIEKENDNSLSNLISKTNSDYILDDLPDIENAEENNERKITQYQYSFNFDKIYIDRLVIKYYASNDTNLMINYTGYDEYGNPVSKQTKMGINSNFNTVTRYIGEDVSNISFRYSDESVNLDFVTFEVKNISEFNIYRYVIIEFILLTISLIYIFRNIVFDKVEYLFIIIATGVGLTQILITPCITRYSWDDQIHYERIYTLFSKEYKVTEAYDFSLNARDKITDFPTTIEDIKMINNYMNSNNKKIVSTKLNEMSYISYDYFTYIPSAIVVNMCRLLNLPYTMIFILGKITILLIYISIMYYAIKNAKVGKRLLLVLGLLPSTIFLASQYSRDSIITAGIYLGISTFMNCYCGYNKMDKKNILIFVFSILIASLSKPIYIPTLLLILILPSKRFEKRKKSNYIKTLIICLFLLMMSTFVFPTVTDSSLISDIRGGDTSTKRQLQLILEQPISFIKVFVGYVRYALFNHTIGSEPFGLWFKFGTIQNSTYYINLLLVLYAAFLGDFGNIKIDGKCKTVLFSINLFIFCLICGSMYLSYTPVATDTIIGAQPRYYIPLLYGFLLCLKSNNIKNNISNKKFGIIVSIIMMYILYSSTYYKIFMTICV